MEDFWVYFDDYHHEEEIIMDLIDLMEQKKYQEFEILWDTAMKERREYYIEELIKEKNINAKVNIITQVKGFKKVEYIVEIYGNWWDDEVDDMASIILTPDFVRSVKEELEIEGIESEIDFYL